MRAIGARLGLPTPHPQGACKTLRRVRRHAYVANLRTYAAAVALAVLGCKPPVHDRVVQDWHDQAALQAIADDLSPEEARLFLGYADVMKTLQAAGSMPESVGSEFDIAMQTMTVRRALFIARELDGAH